MIFFLGVGIVGLYTGSQNIALCGAIIFVCIWISIKGIQTISGWIIAFAAVCAIMQYQTEVISFAIILAAAYIFDVVRRYLVRSNNASRLWYFGVAVIIAGIGWSISMINALHVLKSSGAMVIGTLIMSAVVFYCGDYVIRRMERFGDLYVRGGDLRCHT
jgi:hypothetical protein